MNMFRQAKILVLFLFFAANATGGIYTAIARINSVATPPVLDKKCDALNALMSKSKQFHELVYDNLREQLEVSPYAKRMTIFSILGTYEELHPFPTNTCLDETTWRDLELLCGSAAKPDFYVAQQIDRTITGMGQAVLYRKLVQPLTSYQELIDQQEVVKELVNNVSLSEKLESYLKELVVPENALVSCWSDTFFASMFGKEGFQPPFADKVAWIKKLAQWCDRQELVIEANNQLSNVQFCTWIGASLAGSIALPLVGYEKITDRQLSPRLHWLTEKLGLGAFSMFSVGGALLYLLKFTSNKRFEGYSDILTGTISGLMFYHALSNYKNSLAVDYSIQTKLMHVARYMRIAQELVTLLKQSNSLAQRIPAVQAYDAFMSKISQSHDIARLLKVLQSNTFKVETSWPYYWGRIYVAYRLLMAVKEELVPLMITIGEIDSYLSVARLYKEFKTKPVSFCFPIYETTGTIPHLALKNFWHPLVDPEKAVPNSLEIGAKNPAHIIITGPNAGGKSTTAKALALAGIMAQSFGVAPAQQMSFTPLQRIITYLNITDDLAVGNSHFMAEAQRARDLVNAACVAEKENTFCLCVSDEIFNGTTYKEGQAAAYCLIEKIGAHKNTLSLTCTHFPLLCNLESHGRFANYKVSVGYDQNHQITYPYMLEPGIAHQIVTFDILKEKGFDDEFLVHAQKLIAGEAA